VADHRTGRLDLGGRVKSALLMSLIALWLLAGCATQTATHRPLNPPNDKEAVLVLFRDGGGCRYQGGPLGIRPFIGFSAPDVPCSFQVYVDGEAAASLAMGDYVQFSVPAGERRIEVKWPRGTTMHLSFSGISRTAAEQTVYLHPRQTEYLLVKALRRPYGCNNDLNPDCVVIHIQGLLPGEGARRLRTSQGNAAPN